MTAQFRSWEKPLSRISRPAASLTNINIIRFEVSPTINVLLLKKALQKINKSVKYRGTLHIGATARAISRGASDRGDHGVILNKFHLLRQLRLRHQPSASPFGFAIEMEKIAFGIALGFAIKMSKMYALGIFAFGINLGFAILKMCTLGIFAFGNIPGFAIEM